MDDSAKELELEKARLEIERERLMLDSEIERERLMHEKRRIDTESRFLNKNFGVIITGIIGLATILTSFSQVWIAQISKEKETVIQQARYVRELQLSQEKDDRERRIVMAKFFFENRDVILDEDPRSKAFVRRVMTGTFPVETITALFQSLKETSIEKNEKEIWAKGIEEVETIQLDTLKANYEIIIYCLRSRSNSFSTIFTDQENGAECESKTGGIAKKLESIIHDKVNITPKIKPVTKLEANTPQGNTMQYDSPSETEVVKVLLKKINSDNTSFNVNTQVESASGQTSPNLLSITVNSNHPSTGTSIAIKD